jgi:hypothetical protein
MFEPTPEALVAASTDPVPSVPAPPAPISKGVWIFATLTIALLAALSGLGVFYVKQRSATDSVRAEQVARIAELTRRTDANARNITTMADGLRALTRAFQ